MNISSLNNDRTLFIQRIDKLPENDELIERVDQLFNKFKSMIEDLKISELPFASEEVDYIEQLLKEHNLNDPHLKPNKTISVLPKSAQEFLNQFDKIENIEDKILLTQRLFNTSYKNHMIYYFIAPKLLSKTHPKLTEYINFRNSNYERIFTPAGIRYAIDFRKSINKLTSTTDFRVCENINILEKEIQDIINNPNDVTQMFFLQMDDSHNLFGDHTVPILVIKQSAKIEILITDSAGEKKKFLSSVAQFMQERLPNAHIVGFEKPRQRNLYSCCMLALKDGKTISQNPKEMMKLALSQPLKQGINGVSYKTFATLPESMMKSSQMPLGIEKEVEKWKRKGVLITSTESSQETHIGANKLFAKIERKVLAEVFKERVISFEKGL